MKIERGWVLAGACALGALALQLDTRSRSRESLLPALRTAQRHHKQAKRVMATAAPVGSAEEAEIGRELAARFTKDARREPALDELVRRLGGVGIDAKVYAAPMVNAFALPGGYVFVAEGLWNRLKDKPDALAWVVGHEIGHVKLGHCTDMIRQDAWFRRHGLGKRSPFTIFERLAALSYSEVQELESDRFGLERMHAAGYRLDAARTAYHALAAPREADHAKRGPGELVWEGVRDYFGTHPRSTERMAALESAIEAISR